MYIQNYLKLLVHIFASFMLTGCIVAAGYITHKQNKRIDELEVLSQNAQINPENKARIRFFGQAIIDLNFYRNRTCYKGDEKVIASANGIGGVIGSKKNVSIGMPVTPNVLNLKKRDGFFAKSFYREYAVNAGEPLTVQASSFETTGRVSYTCRGFSVFFVPEKDQDYEVSLDFSGGYCKLNVSAIKQVNSAVEVLPVTTLKKAEKCVD